ncbi:Inactive hydroxysteroid dehydrogenase-like protein [Trichinella spiralis]|uniref:Inactive hydroxysteroid dehydrogenase-like protein n=1 Tax=Trichinella spiralis TaxID=6334 RepID=A0ABR3KGU5_TRISP
MNLLILLLIIILTHENGKTVKSIFLLTITELQVSGSSEEAYINGIRYERKFSAIYVKKNCPIAVCERPCASFQMFRNCPYCDCNGFIYREPCISMEDCSNCSTKFCFDAQVKSILWRFDKNLLLVTE